MNSALNLKDLLNDLPQVGSVEWIGLRPGRKLPMKSVQTVEVSDTCGLVGDRYSGSSGKRHVTLIQAEHLAVIASCLKLNKVNPDQLRRNIVVKGINLLALKDKSFEIGNCVFEFTGLCHPCSAMQTEFGAGGYNAVRGHGGITARVFRSGKISVGDLVSVCSELIR